MRKENHQKWRWHKGFCTWGIQTKPFAACCADFDPKFCNSPILHTGGSNSLLPQRGEGRKWEKGITNNKCDTGVSVLGAFKLDHFQPVELILFFKNSTFLPFILGSPIPYYPRERKAENEKRESPIIYMAHGFLYLWHLNWTIHTGESNSLLPQKEEGRIWERGIF